MSSEINLIRQLGFSCSSAQAGVSEVAPSSAGVSAGSPSFASAGASPSAAASFALGLGLGLGYRSITLELATTVPTMTPLHWGGQC
ncbi:predicted protein [Chaetoceros tenuissimus]|uniref:Uncharacterized protein n=1 Tax=Chaetoceros tenuissimus TaxID=426638 RepID=A0AAD3D4S0_9STRA|nr:predicted protein [Chaetoceros tenuissimus]